MIIDIVRFIVTQGRQIIEFVNAVLDAVIAIASGGGGGVPALVERALARSIPVLIGALAAILGVGGIAGKVKQIFQALSRPVNRAIDWVIDKIVGLVKRLWAKLKAALERGKRRWADRRRRRADRRRKDARPEDSRRRDPRRGRPRRKDPRRQRRGDPAGLKRTTSETPSTSPRPSGRRLMPPSGRRSDSCWTAGRRPRSKRRCRPYAPGSGSAS